MTLIPFENIEFQSPLHISEIEDAINSHVAKTKIFGNAFSKNTYKEYEGFMEGDVFKIRRILKWGQNSFIPISTGIVTENKSGQSTISLKIRLHKLVMIFLIVFTLFTIMLFLIEMFNQPYQNQEVNQLLEQYNLDPIAMPGQPNSFNLSGIFFIIVPYLISTIAFNYESRRVKNKLKMILKVKD